MHSKNRTDGPQLPTDRVVRSMRRGITSSQMSYSVCVALANIFCPPLLLTSVNESVDDEDNLIYDDQDSSRRGKED